MTNLEKLKAKIVDRKSLIKIAWDLSNLGCKYCIGNDDDCTHENYTCKEGVEKWLKNNPVKTLLEVALEILPNIAMEEEKIPKLCPSDLFGEMAMSNNCKNVDSCLACWNRPAALIQKDAIKKNISKKRLLTYFYKLKTYLLKRLGKSSELKNDGV